MSIDYTQQVDPLLLARSGRHLSGQVPIAGMARLLSSLYDASGCAEYDLMFDIDTAGQAIITGWVKAELSLICQRCMDKVFTKVESKVALGIVSNYAEAERLLKKFEPLVVDESQVKLVDIIEDELLLALPLIVEHSDEECLVSKDCVLGDKSNEKGKEISGAPTIDEAMPKKNPFSILKELKVGNLKLEKQKSN